MTAKLTHNPELKPGEFHARHHEDGLKEIESGNCIRFGLIELGIIGEVTLWGHLELDPDNINEFLQADAARALGPGKRFDIREKCPTHYGKSYGRAWYRSPRMDAEAEWPEGVVDGGKQWNAEHGYFFVGKFVTPPQAERLVDRSLDELVPMPERPETMR